MNSGKYAKYKVLLKERGLHDYLPETALFTEANFWRLMNKHKDVMVKPTAGGGGAGIIRVKCLHNGVYQIHSAAQNKRMIGEKKAFSYLQTKIAGKSYIVQRRIGLANYKGRIIDIRVMVQRRRSKSWNVTGKLVKVAGAGFIITNTARSRGYVIPLSVVAGEEVRKELEQIALQAAETLCQVYKGIRTVGLDAALDENGKIWILECNFRPATSLFRKLKDKTMYNRMISYNR